MSNRERSHHLLRARDWQDRPELEHLCEWWHDIGGGMYSLVGIGGAGKTAIIDRFLQIVPGGSPTLLDPTKAPPRCSELPETVAPFIFSFYDVPNEDSFFVELADWLSRVADDCRPATLPADDDEKLSIGHVAQWLQTLTHRRERTLLVLDGLEKVQDDGRRTGMYGHIFDGRLRNLLLDIAEGRFGHLAVVVTTRFDLYDPAAQRVPYYWRTFVEQLAVETCVKLLRARGVQEPDDDLLKRLAVEHGRHALTVDLIGGYIGEFCGGDVSKLQPLGEIDLSDVDIRLHPRRMAVIEQERRFARVAERYQESLSEQEPATLALLERLCLFRLGVDAATLTSIFTGDDEQARKIAGPSLAALTAEQLQQTLDRLTAMKLVEVGPVPTGRDLNATDRPVGTGPTYSIHPAIRDGFLSGIADPDRTAGHEAARAGLTATLGDSPGENPSDPATLDLLEATQAIFLNEWALYLKNLGRLESAAHCYELGNEPDYRNEKWASASIGNQNLSNVRLLSGRLSRSLTLRVESAGLDARPAESSDAVASHEESLRLAELADDADGRFKSYAYRGHARALLGEVPAALADFREALDWQHKNESHASDRPLYSLPGIWHTHLLARLGRREESQQLTEANLELLVKQFGATHHDIPQCHLILASLQLGSGDVSAAERLCLASRDWALARDAKEVLFWSALVQARIELARIVGPVPTGQPNHHESAPPSIESRSEHHESGPEPIESRPVGTGPTIESARSAIDDGLKIARACGFSLYHIDLRLELARLRLLQGAPSEALAAIRTALDETRPKNDETGDPELLAARDPCCGYAWPVPEALQLQAEALLLQAAQELSTDRFDPATESTLPPAARSRITEARSLLTESLDHWRSLRDPARTNANYRINRKQYNYRAAETHRVLTDLEAGILTRYRLTTQPEPEPSEAEISMTDNPISVFFSYTHADEQYKDELIKHLSILKRQSVIDVWHDRMITDGDEWAGEIDEHLEDADIILLLVSADFLASDYCYDLEMKRAMERHDSKEAQVIPIILRTVDWKGAPFGKLQARPKDAKPIDQWPNRDEAFTDIAKGIRSRH